MSLQLLSVNDQGFETSVAGWTQFDSNVTRTQTAAQAQAGTKSMQMSSTAGGDMAVTHPNIPVMPGRTYVWSVWFRAAVSARTCNAILLWFQSDGTTASALHASDSVACTDSSAGWTQTTLGSVVAPLDAFYCQPQVVVRATGAGAEVHYIDTCSLLDAGAPYFKHGRLVDIWLNGVDITPYFNSTDFGVKVATAPVTTFGATWDSHIAGVAAANVTASGYYDSADADKVRDTLQGAIGQLTWLPAGALAIGDQARLLNVNSSDYKTGNKVGGAVLMDWTALSTAPVGIGECLHVLQSENTGTITGTGTPLLTGVNSTTGAVAHLHVTAMTGGDTHTFKLQDSTALNGAYVDIAGGAFVNVTAVGSQRLVVPGTIRAYVRSVSVISGHAATYAIAVART